MSQAGILWPAPPTNWSLNSREIHVWAASLKVSDQTAAELGHLLSPEERQRGQAFHFEADRKAFICGRGLLRVILAAYLDLKPKEIHFEYGARGKPLLAGQAEAERLHFNLAHSDDLFLSAVTRLCPVGVDVERIRPLDNLEDLVSQVLSPKEEILWRRLPQPLLSRTFFNLWTRKEACLKASGEGIAEQLKGVAVSFMPGGPSGALEPPVIPGSSQLWSLTELSPAAEFAAALAAPNLKCDLSCWRWPVESFRND